MGKCVIVGGAPIENYDFIKSRIADGDYVIYCDSGLRHKDKLCKEADLIVGDFDSYENPHSKTETIVLPCEKDDTDTYFAVKEGIRRGFDSFLIIGAVGGRLDHTLGNVSILFYLDSLGKHGEIIDDYSEMEIVSNKIVYVDDSYSYFSLLSLSGTARGIYEKNAKFSLENAVITPDYQYGISNEPLQGKVSEISVSEGRMLLIKVRK